MQINFKKVDFDWIYVALFEKLINRFSSDYLRVRIFRIPNRFLYIDFEKSKSLQNDFQAQPK